MLKRFIYLMLLCLIFSETTTARWHKISGNYANVEYQKEHQALADSLLKIAELGLPRLAKMHGLPVSIFDEDKARIIITGAPDISNGFALGNTVVIYALSSMYMPYWSSKRTWYEMVLTHELAHHVTFRAIRRKLNFFGELANLTVPRWFFEGVAQYFAEKWNTYRGDIYVKNAVLYGKLNYESMKNLNDGRLLYASANAFVRYLAAEHGDSSLIKVMSHNPKGWLFDFDAAFEAVYGKEPRDLFPEFIRHMVLYYGDRFAAYPVNESGSELPSFGYYCDQIIPLIRSDSTYLISAQLDKNHRYKTAYVVQIKDGKTHNTEFITDNYTTDLFISGDQNYIAYGRYQVGIEDNQTAIDLRWQVYDLNEKKKYIIDSNLRARQAAFTPDNRLILCHVQADSSIFYGCDIPRGKRETLFKTAMPVGNLTAVSNDMIVFDAQRPNGNRDLFLIEDNKLKALTNDPIDDRQALTLNDSLLIFNRFTDENPALALYNLNRNSFRIVWRDQYAYWLQRIDREKRTLIIRTWQPDRKNLFREIALDSLQQSDTKTTINETPAAYSDWTRKAPRPVNLFNLPDTALDIGKRKALRFPQAPLEHILTFALPTSDPDLGLGIYGLTAWVEAMQRQTLSASFILFPEDYYQSLFLLTHSLKALNSDFFAAYYHGPVFFAHQNETYIELYQDIVELEWQRRFYVKGNPRFYVTPALSYGGYYHKLNETLPNTPNDFGYHGPRVSFAMHYHLPTRYYPVIPKRLFALSGSYFASLNRQYDFSIGQAEVSLGSNLIWESLGLRTDITYIRQSGTLTPLKSVGIDRFYEFDLPRDFKYTKPLRGIREDISGDELVYATTELNLMLKEKTSYKLLFLPIDNLAATAFFDYARLRAGNYIGVYSYGGSLSFGDPLARFSLGYAIGKLSDDSREAQLYLQFSMYLPE